MGGHRRVFVIVIFVVIYKLFHIFIYEINVKRYIELKYIYFSDGVLFWYVCVCLFFLLISITIY